ncbi:MAG: D-alanyl-D-alanine carboxypeptidase family protein [Acidimicrobiales bacterium]
MNHDDSAELKAHRSGGAGSGCRFALNWRAPKPVGFVALVLVSTIVALPGGAQTTTTTAPTTTAPPTTAESTTSTDPSTTTTAPPSTTTTAPQATTAAPTTATTTSATTSGQTTTTVPGTTTPQPSTTADAERRKVEAAESAKAREVDAANAKLSELTNALAVLQSDVATSRAEVEIASRRLSAAEAIAAAAEEDVATLEAQVAQLEFGLSDQAIRSFKGDVVEENVLSLGRNPNEALRMQAMLAKATQSDVDYVNALTGVRDDLSARRADADEALTLAEESKETSEEQLRTLEGDRLAQGQLASGAEQRLDHLLSERAALARLGAEIESGLDPADTEALVAQLANAPAPAPPSASSSTPPASISESDIRLAGNGIEVHVDIVDNVRRLLADAAADGVLLAGGGYRDSAGQIAARRNNCGTSNYAIYEMPSSRCRPPTARPGKSQHEQGKAIDFTYNGALIRSRSGAGWNWLNAHANDYGLFNLPSEPWHWSVNGR